MTSNVFDSLWVEKYRPGTLDDMILSDKNRKYFENVKRKGKFPHLMFSGIQGSGKSSLAKVLVNSMVDCQYLYINASSESGIDTIRTKVTNFAETLSLDGKLKAIILDECDGLSNVRGNSGTSAQQALRSIIENYAETTRFILTCNYPSMVLDAIKSRCQQFDLSPPFEDVVKRAIHVLKSENVVVPDEERPLLENLIKDSYPDVRKMIGSLQQCSIDGVFRYSDERTVAKTAQVALKMIVDKSSHTKIREYIIKNEVNFGNDYHRLMKDLFEGIYSSTDLTQDQKRVMLLTVSAAMYQHQSVMDKEINFYACVLELIGG